MTDRDLAEQGICPLCRVGPWRSLGIHVAKKHGLDARAFKERVGLPWSASLSAPEVAEAQRARAVELNLVAAMRRSPHATGTSVSPAGAAARRPADNGWGSTRPRKIPADAGPSIQARRDRGELLRHVAATYDCSVAAVSLFMTAWRRGGRH